jgi:hypothetical protein
MFCKILNFLLKIDAKLDVVVLMFIKYVVLVLRLDLVFCKFKRFYFLEFQNNINTQEFY